ncbi:MAG TPA: ABC transporter permease [Candidatus Dorea gallistercoris]|uniref:ABC transporter permease n=1 Tax=Candidatus Dorea gallistercoris TaxID=2838542 RepID=A0A9D1RAJ2_9FIRM|nr:ABC transporter permease [Candidatus Dorea gallistercoris]
MTTNSKLRQNAQKYSIFLILIAMFIICSILSPYFLTSNNLINILRQTCVGLLIAYGEMILIIAGFLDLSVASVLALSGVLAVDTYRHTQSLIAALAVAIGVSILCNLFNAFFVAQFDVPAFIATLGMQEIARGIALYYCGGSNILQLGDFVVLGQGTVGPIPIPVIIVFLISIVIWYLVNETRWGRSLYAIGGNRNAAVASGINVKVSIYKAYIINGIMAAFAGVIFMARNNAGLPNGAVGYEMNGLTAAIVGGTSFTGGIGTVMGTVAGAFIIAFLENIMNLIGIDSYIQQIIKGAIIVIAVAFDVTSKGKKSAKVIIADDSDKKKEAK